MSPRALGATLAFIFLAVYIYLVWVASSVANCEPKPECLTSFNERMASALALIGGLISALVVAELAITPPREAPVGRAFGVDVEGRVRTVAKGLTSLYLIVWALTGVYAFVVGLREEAFQPLTDLGQSWFGIAIAAVYAYLGIKPQNR